MDESDKMSGKTDDFTWFNEWGVRNRLKKLARFQAVGGALDVGYIGSPNPFLKDAVGVDMIKPKIKPNNYWYVDKVLPDGRLPFPDKSFSCVVAGEVIEHTPNLDLFMKEINRVLKFGGFLCISTPNPQSPVEVIVHFWHWIRGYKLNQGKAGWHIHEFPTSNMITLLNIYGFQPFKIEGTYIQIPFTKIQINIGIVPLTYSTIYYAQKKVK
jgi:SAM-dependent methyltransferase